MSLSYRDRLEKRKELQVEAEQWKQAYDASLAERIRLEDAIEDLEVKHTSLQQEAQENLKLVDQLETSLKADREAIAKHTGETADVQKKLAELQKEKQSQEKVVQQAVRQLKTANASASAKQEEIEAKKAKVQNRLDASERDMLQQLDSLRVELIDVRRRDADLRAATAAASSVETEVELLRFSAQQASVGGLKRSLLETMAASKQHCDKLQLLTAQVQYDKKQLLYMRDLVQSTVKVIREELESLEADPAHEPPQELLVGEARDLTQYIMQREAIRPFERAEAADTPGHNHSFAHDLESGAMPVEVDADVASDLSRSRALLGSPDPVNTSLNGGRGAPGSAGSRQGAGGAYGYKLNLQFEDSGYGPRFRQLEHAWVLGEGSIDADDEGEEDNDTEGTGRPYGPGAGLDSESLMDGGAASTMSVGPSASVMTQGTSASGNILNAKSARAARAMRQISNKASQRRGTFFGMYTADHKKPAQRQARASTAGPVRAQNLMRRSFVLPGRQVSGLLDASTLSGGNGGGGASTYTASMLDVSVRHAAKDEWTLDDKIRAQFMQRRAKSAGPEGRTTGREGGDSSLGAPAGAMGSPEGRVKPARRQSYAHVEPRYLQHLEQSDGEYTNSDTNSDDENLDGKARKERKKRLASKKSSWRRGTFFGMYSKQSAHSADEADPGKANAKKRQKKADKKKGRKKQAGMSKTVGSLGTLSETGDKSDESQTTSGSNSDGGVPDDNAPLRARQAGNRGANTYRRGTFFGMYKPSEAANQSRSSSAGASSRRGRRGKRSKSPKPSIVQPKWNTSTNQGSHNRKSKKSEVVAQKRRNTLYAAYRLNLDLEEEESDENDRSRSRSKGSPGKSVIASMTSPIKDFKKQAKQRRTSKAFETVKPRYLDALSKIEKQKSEAAKAAGVVEEAEEKVVVKKLTSQRRGTFFGMYSKSASAEMRERQQQMILMSDPYRRGAAIKQSPSSSPPAQGQGGKGEGKTSGAPGVDTYLIPECRTQEVWLGALRTYEKSPAGSRGPSPKLGPQSALTPRMRRLSTALSPSQQAHIKSGEATVVITGLKRAGRKITAPMEREDGRFVPLRNLTAAWHDTLRGTGGLSDRVAHHLEDMGDEAFAASPRSRNRSRANSFEEGPGNAAGLGLGARESRLKRSWSGRSSAELDAGEAKEAGTVATPHRPAQAHASSPAVTDLLQRARTAFYSSDVPAQVASPQSRSPPGPSNGAGQGPRPYVHPTPHATHGGDNRRPAFTSPIQTSRGTQRMGKPISPSYAQSSSRSPPEQPRVVQLSASSRRRGSYFGLYSPHQVAEVSNKQLRQEYKEDPTRLGSDVQDEVAADMERMRMKLRMQKQQQPAHSRSPPQTQRGSYGSAW